MNQTLVSPCPNCGFDASKHNKVLYNGIFLICYNCGHGWYYNIEVSNPNKYEYVNNNSIVTDLLNHRYDKNSLLHNNYIFKQKNNKIQTKNKSLHQKTISSNNKKYNKIVNKHSKVDNDLNYSDDLDKKIKYQNKNKYSNNVYYEPTTNKKVYTKKQSYNISNVNEHPSKKPTTNKDTYVKIDNTINLSLRNKSTESFYGEKPTLVKKLQQTINTSKKNNLKCSKNIVIDINKISKINDAQSNFISTTKDNKKNIFKNLEGKNNLSSIGYDIPKQPILEATINNNYITKKSDVSTNKMSKNIVVVKDKLKDIKNNSLPAPENTNTFLSNKNVLTKEANSDNSLSKPMNLPLSLNEQNQNSQTPYKKYFENNYSEFEDGLINKTSLGLANVNLLKFEEQSNYSLKQFKVPLLDTKQFISSVTDVVKDISLSILKIPTLIFAIFTRLDLFLKTLAYTFILTISIGFLTYSYYKKQNSIKSTALKNSDCKDETLIESNKNLIFENDNFSATNNLDSDNIVKNHSLHKENLKIAEEKPEEKTIAFEKYKGKNNLDNPDINILESTKLNKQPTEKLSLLDTLKATINNSLFSIKKMQANAFNKIKIYNDEFSLQGEYNDTLLTCATLCNEDYKNTYLIKSLEVIFLEKSGKKIGKRFIIANQLINANSAITINLKINNPPKNTTRVIIFIKDKKQI